MSRMKVAFFDDRAEAEPICQRLVQAGIRAEIHYESGLAKLWFVSKRRAGFQLEVCAKDVERVRHLMARWDAEYGCMKPAVRCPECGSLRIEFPQFTEKSFLTNLAMGLLAELRFVEREYYCEDCHFMWAKPNTTHRRVRAHMAPNYFLAGFRHERFPEASPCPGEPSETPAPSEMNGSGGKKGESRTNLHRFRRLKSWRRVRGIITALGLLALLDGRAGALASEGHYDLAEANISKASSKLWVKRVGSSGARQFSANSGTPTYLRDVLPILMGKCARCHGNQSQFMQNWLDYKTASGDRWEIKRRVWDSWKGAYFKQPMPTANSPEAEAITDEERMIIRDWVESGSIRGVRPSFNSTQSKAERIAFGKRLFGSICAACHQPTGQGIPGRIPPLARSDLLNSDKHRVIRILVNGLQGEVMVNGQTFNNSMPKFPLSDEDIACALTYVYNSFGNSGKEVTPMEVSAARTEKLEPNMTGQSPTARVPEEKSPFE